MRRIGLCALLLIFALGTYSKIVDATVTTFTAASGTDATGIAATSFTSTPSGDLFNLSVSDNHRMSSSGAWPTTGMYDENKYLEFVFAPNLPDGTTIQTVTLTHEYYETGTLAAAKLEVWNGASFVSVPLSLPAGTGTDKETSQTLDLTSLITSVAQLNQLRVRFLAYRSGGSANTKTGHDYMALVVNGNVPPVATAFNLSTKVDAPLAILASGADADGDSLTYRVVTPPQKGTLGEFSGAGITYTPSGHVGTDSFTYLVSDGVHDSQPATVTITLTPGALASLTLSSDADAVHVGDTFTLTAVGADSYGNILTNDIANGVTFFAGDATIGSAQLAAGVAHISVQALTEGDISYSAKSGAISSPPVVVTITKNDVHPKDPVVAPTALPLPGEYTSAQSVQLSATTGSIHYAVDGSMPVCTSALFTDPIVIAATTTISAMSCTADNHSDVATFVYTIVPPVVVSTGGGGSTPSIPSSTQTVAPADPLEEATIPTEAIASDDIVPQLPSRILATQAIAKNDTPIIRPARASFSHTKAQRKSKAGDIPASATPLLSASILSAGASVAGSESQGNTNQMWVFALASLGIVVCITIVRRWPSPESNS